MPAPIYLLDTNILLHLIRAKPTGLYIDATFQMRQQYYTPLICVSHTAKFGLLPAKTDGARRRGLRWK